MVKVFYQLPERAMFEYDQEYLASSAKALLVDHKLTLIGAPTSVGGMFIGPYYNYLAAAFFLVFNYAPIAITLLTALWHPVTVLCTYVIVNDLFSRRTAAITAFLMLGSLAFGFYALNPPLVQPIPVLSLILFWSLIRSWKNPRWLLLTTVVLGFSFHLHFSSFILLILTMFFLFLLRPKVDLSIITGIVIIFSLFIAPLVFFDIRHNFLIAKNAINFTLAQNSDESVSLPLRLAKILETATGNMAFLLTFNQLKFFGRIGVIILMLGFFPVLMQIPKKRQVFAFLTFFWSWLYILFFIFYQGVILPYYFVAIEPFYFVMLGIVISSLFEQRREIVIVFFALYGAINAFQWLTFSSPLGVVHKLNALNFIKDHSQNKPIYLSHTIEKGYEGGFSYLEWYLHLNQQENRALPIYTLVVPYDWITVALDYRSGSVGVIVPKGKTLRSL